MSHLPRPAARVSLFILLHPVSRGLSTPDTKRGGAAGEGRGAVEGVDGEMMNLTTALVQHVYAAHPKWTLDRLVAEVQEQFVTARYAEIVVPHFLRLEAGYIARFACPECIGVDGENKYLDCETCSQAVSNRAWWWFEKVFMPNHPEWHAPDGDAVRETMERLKEPQLRMFA